MYLPDKDDPTAVANVYGVARALEVVKHDDPLSATRRAIVRVAAEVGRDKETPNSYTEIFTSLGAKVVPDPGDNQPKEE